jgi:hypothetical protein
MAADGVERHVEMIGRDLPEREVVVQASSSSARRTSVAASYSEPETFDPS